MKTYGLVGLSLYHSLSQKYFQEKFKNENIKNVSYQLFSINNIFEIIDIIDQYKSLLGLNITIPYKEQIIPLLNQVSDVAQQVGAVNTLVIQRKETKIFLKGYNTDVYGFKESLLHFIPDTNLNALIIGNGGASKAAQFVCKTLDINYKIVQRNCKSINSIDFYSLNEETFDNHQLIINCTPVGTLGNTDKFPFFPYKYLSSKHYVFDMVYNPLLTELLTEAKKKNAKIKNGLEMLHLQAEKSWEIWNNFNNFDEIL